MIINDTIIQYLIILQVWLQQIYTFGCKKASKFTSERIKRRNKNWKWTNGSGWW